MFTDRRYYSRMPIPKDHSGAVLRAGQREFATRLVDVSAFGYAVICPPDLNPHRGEKLVLGTTAGWVEAEVVRVHDDANGIILGLTRVRELARPRSSCLDPIGGHAAVWIAIAALVAGAVFGAAMAAEPKQPWKRIQREFRRIVSFSR